MKPSLAWLLGTGGMLLVVWMLIDRILWPATRPGPESVTETVVLKSNVVPVIYAQSPLQSEGFHHPRAVARAISFLKMLQPHGTYVLSILGQPKVVPMDVAHAAIAFANAGQLRSAEGAMTWLYERQIRQETGQQGNVDYSGSWYDDMKPDGSPIPGTPRGRGESVGMALIATYSIYSQDPRYLQETVGDQRVIDLVQSSVDYLTRPTMQAPDGRFYHSPDYEVSFNEECARMTLGLQLAGRMLQANGDEASAQLAKTSAERGFQALQHGTEMSQGMAYDYYGRAIWGLASSTAARAEVDWLRSTGLVDRYGVRNWDWQLTKPEPILNHLHWWLQSQTVSPSQTFDYAIACVAAGDIQTAVNLEERWLPLQRADGGFDDAFLFGLRLGFGQPTSYAVSRFILLERVLTNVLGPRIPTTTL